MKKLVFLSLVLLLAFFVLTGCKGEKKEKEADVSTEKKIEEKEEAENLYLTEKEVKAFIEAFPVFVEITKKKEKEVEPLTDREDLLGGIKFAGEIKEYKEEIDAALKDYGFTFESFASAYGKVFSAVAYGEMAKAFEQAGEGMKQMLDNPLLSEEEKEEIRKNLEEAKEAKESEEMKACKENWKIVQKYEDEIIKILGEK
jgi:type III secretory pathway component EscV